MGNYIVMILIFVFYSKSSDKKPGMGAGEKIAEGDVEKYVPLTKMKKLEKEFYYMYVKKDEAGNVVPLFKLDGKELGFSRTLLSC